MFTSRVQKQVKHCLFQLLKFEHVINPRRACAARVTVHGLRVSWGAIFSVMGEKGGKKGRGQRSTWGGKFKCHEKEKVHRKAVDEQDLLLSSFIDFCDI